MTKRILILGSNGQLGSELKSVSQNYPYSCFFTNSAELDIQNTPLIADFIRKNQIKTIINAAAYTRVDDAETNQKKAESVNTTAVNNLGEVCKQHNLSLIHISTDYVFGENTTKKPLETESPTNPENVYGQTKLKGEFFLNNQNLPHSAIIRTSWLFSQYGNNFVKTILNLGKEKSSINVVSDQFGRPTYAKDLAKFIFDIIPQLTSKNIETYHFANAGETSWYKFAKKIMKIANLSCNINPIATHQYPTPAKRPVYSILDTRKTEKTFNISISSWQDALKDCIYSIEKKKA